VNCSQLEQWAREEEERRQAEADELERLRQSNERARQERLAHLKVQEDAKRAEAEAKLELEPIKMRERRQWLVDH
jgi:hypothetical protein